MNNSITSNQPELTVMDSMVQLETGLSIMNELLTEWNSKDLFKINTLEELTLLVVFRSEYVQQVCSMINTPLGSEVNLDLSKVWELADEAEDYLQCMKSFYLQDGDGEITIPLLKLAELWEFQKS